MKTPMLLIGFFIVGVLLAMAGDEIRPSPTTSEKPAVMVTTEATVTKRVVPNARATATAAANRTSAEEEIAIDAVLDGPATGPGGSPRSEWVGKQAQIANNAGFCQITSQGTTAEAEGNRWKVRWSFTANGALYDAEWIYDPRTQTVATWSPNAIRLDSLNDALFLDLCMINS